MHHVEGAGGEKLHRWPLLSVPQPIEYSNGHATIDLANGFWQRSCEAIFPRARKSCDVECACAPFSERLNQPGNPDPDTSTVPKRWAVVDENFHDFVSLLVTGRQAGLRRPKGHRDATRHDC